MKTEDRLKREEEEANKALNQMQQETEVVPKADAQPAPEPMATPQSPAKPASTPIAPDPSESSARNPEESLDEMRAKLMKAEQRNATLQGMILKETRERDSVIDDLQRGMEDMKASLQQGKPSEPPRPAAERHLKDGEKETYGDDAIDFQSRVARGVAEDEMEKQAVNIKKRMDGIEKKLYASQVEENNRALERRWRKIEELSGVSAMALNLDSDFKAWLLQPDVAADPPRSRKEIGDEAFRSGDLKRVADLFIEFASETGRLPEGRRAAPASVPKPERTSARAQSDSSSKPILRKADYDQLVDNYSRGKWKGREKEFQAKLAEYETATWEGRVR